MSNFTNQELIASKLFAGFFGVLFVVLGAQRSIKVLELIITQKHDIELYETSEIYVDFGAKGYCTFNGIVSLFFMGLGVAFLYLGVFKRDKYEGYGEGFELNFERALN